jgi:hypothetical protein
MDGKTVVLHQAQYSAFMSKKRITACISGIQGGKGLWKRELVFTPSGYVPMEQIKVGDVVFDRNGKKTNVIGVYPQGDKDCYELFFSDGKKIITDEDHLFVIIDPHQRGENVLSVKQLLTTHRFYWTKPQKKFIRCRIPSCKPIELDKKQLFISPYIMGCLLGDGSLVQGITVTLTENQMIERISGELPENLQIKNIDNDKKIDYRITEKIKKTTSTGQGFNCFVSEIRRLGLFGHHSWDKFIPDIYKYSDIWDRLNVLRGLMDTDGYIKQNKEITYYSTSKQLARDVIWLVESLGGKAWISSKIPKFVHKGERKNGRECFIVKIIIKDFNPFFLSRKADKYFIHENTSNKILYDIKPVGKLETICIKVDSPTETFIAKDQIVTHNTKVGADWLLKQVGTYLNETDCFIITVPTYKTWRQATSFHFNQAFEGYGKHNIQDSTFTLAPLPGHKQGRTIYIRSMDNPWSIEGITNCRAIWCDEAGQYKYQAWVNIQGRAAFREADIFITTTPYSLNWLYTELYKPWTQGKMPYADIFQWRSIDNPYFPKAEYERQKAQLDSRTFAMKYEGTFQKMAGLVYEDFDQALNQVDPFGWLRFRERFHIYAGVDWGYSNPFAIAVRLIAKDGSADYQIDEFLRSYMTQDECVQVSKDFQRRYEIEQFYCDEEAPDYIAAFNAAGLSASPVKKGKGSVMSGIALHNSRIKTRLHKLVKGKCPATIDEYETYAFPERGDDSENAEENPIDANNHLMSANRYVTMATQWILEKAQREDQFVYTPTRRDLLTRRHEEKDWISV